MRPDGHYGLSKAFGENLAQFYFDRYGIETVSLRIGSSFPAAGRPPHARHLDELRRPRAPGRRRARRAGGRPLASSTACPTTATTWWDNTLARHIGYRPQDSSEPFRAAAEARQPLVDPTDPVARYQGGGFVTKGPYE